MLRFVHPGVIARKLDRHLTTHASQQNFARNLERCGDLLREIEKAHNHHDAANRTKVGAVPSRKRAAFEAGLSERQHKTAIRVSNIPEKEFEEANESDDPMVETEEQTVRPK